jgi:hypothetical protein
MIYYENKRSTWSDTGGNEYDSPGDSNRIINLNALNIEGPDMSMSRHIGRRQSAASRTRGTRSITSLSPSGTL